MTGLGAVQVTGGGRTVFTAGASPLEHIRAGFERLLRTPNAGRYREAFRVARLEIIANMAQAIPIESFNNHRTFIEQERIFVAMLETAIKERDWSFRSWIQIVRAAPFMLASDSLWHIAEGDAIIDPIEKTFLSDIVKYLGHDNAHSSPVGIMEKGKNDLCLLCEPKEQDVIPEPARPLLLKFARNYRRLTDYQRDLPQMGEAFFAPNGELASFPQITGGELEEYARMFAFAFGLRFVSTCFTVTTEPLTAEPIQNTVVILVDPHLRDVKLPLMLLLPKLACDIKNLMRVVQNREEVEGQTSLGQLMRGKAVPQPVVARVEAARIDAQTWELKFYDNGRGIIVEELFRPLVAACKADRNSVNVNPALLKAALDWEAGNPFAFNDIPYGHLLEAVFLLGVSGAKPGKGSGMGLWGSAALLTKLGGQLRVGVTPGGGFYQSIILPIDCSVPSKAVAEAATRFWLKAA
ncbi:MAG: hypothetical protein WCT39_03750 [Candidatus Margulisiibacteriota bacterium]